MSKNENTQLVFYHCFDFNLTCFLLKGVPYLQSPKLGEGGFGTMFAATRISDGLEVAIKYIPKELADMVEDPQNGLIPLEVALLL